MRKPTVSILAALAFAAPASAHTIGASFSTSVGYHGFTLKAARRMVDRYQQRQGFPVAGLRCAWGSIHRIVCQGTWAGVVLTGGQSETLRLVDYVTRSGPCSLTGRITHRHGLTYITGHKRYGNCFTGPLVVEAGSTLLA